MAMSKNITDRQRQSYRETSDGDTAKVMIGDAVESTLLNAVEETGASDAVLVIDSNMFTFQTIKTGTATVKIQVSLDGTNWDDTTITDADNINSLTGKYKYIRANVTAYTDGTVTVLMLSGN